MIKWFKRSSQTPEDVENQKNMAASNIEERLEQSDEILPAESRASLNPSKESIFTRFKKSLSKTRHQLGDGIASLLLGKKEINQDLLEELETLLVAADLGLETTHAVVKEVTHGLNRKELSHGASVYRALTNSLKTLLNQHSQIFSLEAREQAPFVILMVGVNGAGKTTTIGKLAKQFQKQGKKVMLAAGDTFRAAAVEQLQVWGQRNEVTVIAQHTGADSASVIFDALQAAKARKVDVLIADTAGRLHTQNNLMEELKKIKKVLQKLDSRAPHETMLVLDAGIGQNALVQAKQFHKAIGLTGITMTKLDGTAKGGILFAIANELKLPFRYLGVGEGIDDLRPFDAEQFVGALFDHDSI
jgi:fused signal recognition particle receptor